MRFTTIFASVVLAASALAAPLGVRQTTDKPVPPAILKIKDDVTRLMVRLFVETDITNGDDPKPFTDMRNFAVQIAGKFSNLQFNGSVSQLKGAGVDPVRGLADAKQNAADMIKLWKDLKARQEAFLQKETELPGFYGDAFFAGGNPIDSGLKNTEAALASLN